MIHQLTRRLAEDMATKLDPNAGPYRREALIHMLCLERPTLEDACEVVAAGIADQVDAGLIAEHEGNPVWEPPPRWLRVVRRWEAKHRAAR